MFKWKIAKPGTRFCCTHIPVGSVYGFLPECARNGKHYMGTFVWISDFTLIREKRHFVVNMLREGYSHQRKVYVDGNYGWAKSMKEFVHNAGISVDHATPVILRRDAKAIAPRERKVGEYMRRGYPTKEDNPHIITQKYVTDGCQVGHNFYVEEGYCAIVLGMGTPKF